MGREDVSVQSKSLSKPKVTRGQALVGGIKVTGPGCQDCEASIPLLACAVRRTNTVSMTEKRNSPYKIPLSGTTTQARSRVGKKEAFVKIMRGSD